MKRTPLILGSGERSDSKGFGMRKVTKFQEASVVTLGSSFPHLSATLFGGGTCSPPAPPGVLSCSPAITSCFPPHVSFQGLPSPPLPSLMPGRERPHTEPSLPQPCPQSPFTSQVSRPLQKLSRENISESSPGREGLPTPASSALCLPPADWRTSMCS